MSPRIQPRMSQAADKPFTYVKPINPINIYPLLLVANEDTPTKRGINFYWREKFLMSNHFLNLSLYQ